MCETHRPSRVGTENGGFQSNPSILVDELRVSIQCHGRRLRKSRSSPSEDLTSDFVEPRPRRLGVITGRES